MRFKSIISQAAHSSDWAIDEPESLCAASHNEERHDVPVFLFLQLLAGRV